MIKIIIFFMYLFMQKYKKIQKQQNECKYGT